MTDSIERAQDREQLDREFALRQRKPVPQRCEECGAACAVLSNGARARFCDEHLAVFIAERAACRSGVCE